MEWLPRREAWPRAGGGCNTTHELELRGKGMAGQANVDERAREAEAEAERRMMEPRGKLAQLRSRKVQRRRERDWGQAAKPQGNQKQTRKRKRRETWDWKHPDRLTVWQQLWRDLERERRQKRCSDRWSGSGSSD